MLDGRRRSVFLLLWQGFLKSDILGVGRSFGLYLRGGCSVTLESVSVMFKTVLVKTKYFDRPTE